MLKFANRPPQGPEDISLSESGVTLLRYSPLGAFALNAVGQSSGTEIIDSFDGNTTLIADPERFADLTQGVVEEVEELLGRDKGILFANGMKGTHFNLIIRYGEAVA